MKHTWWKNGVIYQIYPRSFQDSNGDGIGDLSGITARVPYLAKLGVDIVWLSPVYQSPNDDNGYDISDYYAIMPEFGTMADFDHLLDTLHAHGIKLVMDLVVNHTSDEHAWFQQARTDPHSPYRDYYIWRPAAADGGPPNNWRSFFSGSAWAWDEAAEAYYLHLFSRKQPDLNWENPAVRQEVYKLMRFWLDKGVDGFRMDVIPLISKRPGLPDLDWEQLGTDFGAAYANGPRVHEFLQEMHREVLQHYDLVTIGEGIGVQPDQALDYVGADRAELNMIFHFGHMFLDWGPGGRWDPQAYSLPAFTRVFETWDQAVGDQGWNTIYLGNHDFPRLVSRFGDTSQYHSESAKLLATLLFTLRGTPTIYQGDEIGMTNAPFARVEDYRDVDFFNALAALRAAGGDEAAFLKAAATHARDHARTPMQWTAQAPAAGFSDGTPWILVNPNHTEINVTQQEHDPHSILAFYRQLIQLRRENPHWIYGETEILEDDHPNLYVYARTMDNHRSRIVLNFSAVARQTVDPQLLSGKLVLTNYPEGEVPPTFLRPWEARIYQVWAPGSSH
ncbi:MAG: alpha-glucosidase [Bacteroidetes bacterium]|nr:MAG: alpha-glucosidase [Bacteroidota bacterium]